MAREVRVTCLPAIVRAAVIARSLSLSMILFKTLFNDGMRLSAIRIASHSRDRAPPRLSSARLFIQRAVREEDSQERTADNRR